MLIRRKKGVAYYDTHLWVPKTSDPQVDRLRRSYKFLLPDCDERGNPQYLYLRRDAPHHLIVPRTAVIPNDIVDLTPKFRVIRPRNRITLDYQGGTVQRESIDAWMSTKGGVLNLGCGKGKTVVALEAIARKRVPALIVVPSSGLYDQWLKRITEFLDDISIGVIRGAPSTWSWDRDIVVATLHTLWEHVNSLTPKIRCHPGIIVFDEIHRLPAEKLSVSADIFPGERYGLTATTERADRRQLITRHHVGPVFYSNLKQLPPTIYFQMVNFIINFRDPLIKSQIIDRRGDINLGRLRTFIGRYEPRNRWLTYYILWLYELNRQLLVLTHSKDQVYILRDMLVDAGIANVGVCTGDETTNREEVLASNQIVIGTADLAREGLDKQKLDTLLCLSSFGRDIAGANAIQQSMGRVLRVVEGKDPIVIFVYDLSVPMFFRMAAAMTRTLDLWPPDKGGPLSYTYVPVGERPPIGRK